MARILLYEWAAAGGLESADGGRLAQDPALGEVIRREGLAMLTALARDVARAAGLSARVVVADGIPFQPVPGIEVIRLPRGHEPEGLITAAADCDCAILVAPETDGLLERRVGLVARTRCRVVGPSAGFLSIASDKQATVEALAAAGVPVPAGCSIRRGQRPPQGFRLPMIRKHRCSTGGEGAVIVRTRAAADEPAVYPERVEAYATGTPIAVSLLCGPGCVLPMPAVEQRIAGGPRPCYLGGCLPVTDPLAHRGERLAMRALAALVAACPRDQEPTIAGWVGVDMVLGSRADGRDDRVLEINPRVTTSLVGLATLAESSLVEATVAASEGRMPWVSFREVPRESPLVFAADDSCLPAHGQEAADG